MEAARPRPLAVVTGASSGIGFELAKVFAEEGFDLLLAAEDTELEGANRELAGTGAGVESARVDLATPAGVEDPHGRIAAIGRPVAAIALNAGRGAGGAFATETKLEDELDTEFFAVAEMDAEGKNTAVGTEENGRPGRSRPPGLRRPDGRQGAGRRRLLDEQSAGRRRRAGGRPRQGGDAPEIG
jgi:NAD(P)-dependent dehydrogenase (short-subunit alcohol dehydrogenase family)